MKKSELYHMAALIVCDNKVMTADLKLDIIEQLLKDKALAELIEKKGETTNV